MYVAVTRAEKMLFLTESEGFDMSNQQDKYPSRFIGEIEAGLLKIEGNIDPHLLELSREFVSKVDAELKEANQLFGIGELVIHSSFGVGKILEWNSSLDIYIVQFKDIARSLDGSTLSMYDNPNDEDKELIIQIDSLAKQRTKAFSITRFEVNDIIKKRNDPSYQFPYPKKITGKVDKSGLGMLYLTKEFYENILKDSLILETINLIKEKIRDKAQIIIVSGGCDEYIKRILFMLSVLFSAFMVIGRLISGVHWFTDIIGSILLSLGLFCIYKALILRCKK